MNGTTQPRWSDTVVVLTVQRCLNENTACNANVPLLTVHLEAVLAGTLSKPEGPFAARWSIDEREAHWAVRGGVDYAAWLSWGLDAPASGERWIVCVRECSWVPPSPSDVRGLAPVPVTSVPEGFRELVVAPEPREPWSKALEQSVRAALATREKSDE